MIYVLMYLYFSSLMSLLIIRKHVFMCLISLEFIVISLLMISVYYLLMFSSSYYIMILMMVFFVCEGVLGLSVLVSLIRCYGNDYLTSMFLW
uniref:NADH dehydrogenase subunit 4L n=1 Tax=Leofa pulchella TaxID=1671235 RepID=UPI002434E57B|nr:NADH dehydrogenase subunit 4L [Leofa pulchella]WEU77778.1 NADH dehydrogenase subunit 4L [Leofa pulchella]